MLLTKKTMSRENGTSVGNSLKGVNIVSTLNLVVMSLENEIESWIEILSYNELSV